MSHRAFDSVFTWAHGDGCSASARLLTMTLASPREGEKFQTGDAHFPQNWRTFARGVLNRDGSPEEGTQLMARDGTSATVVKAAPWMRRQKPQWQLTTGPMDPSTVN